MRRDLRVNERKRERERERERERKERMKEREKERKFGKISKIRTVAVNVWISGVSSLTSTSETSWTV